MNITHTGIITTGSLECKEENSSSNSAVKCRNHKLDILKSILIFLVVIGHVMPRHAHENFRILYYFIYSFHMPAFIFLLGYTTKFNLKRILSNLVYPLVLWTFWANWFLVSAIFYSLLSGIINFKKRSHQIIFFIISIVVSIISGFYSGNPDFLAIMRTSVFLPFFVAGFYCKKNGFSLNIRLFENRKLLKSGVILVILLFIIAAFIFIVSDLDRWYFRMFHRQTNFSFLGYSVFIRIFTQTLAATWILLLLLIVPNKKINFIYQISINTLSIFLFEVAILSFLRYPLNNFTDPMSFLLTFIISIIVSVIMVVLFSSKYFVKYTKFLWRWPFS